MKINYLKIICLINLLIINISLLNAKGIFDKDNEEEKYLVLENDYKISPSGLYKLFLNSNDEERYYYFSVTDIDNNIIFIEPEKYYKRFTFFLCWDDNIDIIWCYSGDIGVYYWINENNKWEKNTYHNDRNPPYILKKLRPKYL